MSSVAAPATMRKTRAPIETLCVEILTEIFRLCIYGDYCRYFDVFDYLHGPWMFGQVSSSWRYAANNTPSLWTSFTTASHYVAIRDPTSMISVVLQRSAGLRLNMELFSCDQYSPEVVEQIFRAAISHSRRWERVELDLNRTILPIISQISHSALDNLSYIKVHGPELVQGDRIDAFQCAPALQTVDIDGNFESAQFEFPLENIVTYFDRMTAASPLTIHRLFDVIQRCTAVETLYAPYQCTDSIHHLSTPIHRPSLRYLTACEPAILRSVVLPRLKRMCLSSEEGSAEDCPDDALPALLGLIQLSKCNLTSLTFNHALFTDVLFDILDLTPTVESLHLSVQYWQSHYNAIFKSLIDRLTAPNFGFLPLIRDFRMNIHDRMGEGPCRFIDHSFFDMVSLRWKSEALKVVRLTISEPGEGLSWSLTSEHIDQLREFKNDGLDINVVVERYTPGIYASYPVTVERFV
ncbi:uncharacterized protein ARMOST_18985 [Armillaria ostoyae]|uniref:F-box domain-containing protein n=1 Tax=Armillaria ostoyae TaxID=47428 RepID=A0A284S3D9_ARMOS|nr:uncharacterized protein ARMOST_18985 [Armillaria ostoyae]